jgi:hypothetical protein
MHIIASPLECRHFLVQCPQQISLLRVGVSQVLGILELACTRITAICACIYIYTLYIYIYIYIHTYTHIHDSVGKTMHVVTENCFSKSARPLKSMPFFVNKTRAGAHLWRLQKIWMHTQKYIHVGHKFASFTRIQEINQAAKFIYDYCTKLAYTGMYTCIHKYVHTFMTLTRFSRKRSCS